MEPREGPDPAIGSGLPAAGSASATRKAAHRVIPTVSSEFAHLDLDGLRAYRRALTTEEGKVSYWRRILQARLDVLREGRLGLVDSAQLRPVLTDKRVGSGRQALLDVVPVDDIPPLPNLAELWDRRVEPGDDAALAALEADLTQAEMDLSSYRSSLHRRIGVATGELIARYREQPTLCLSALPLQPNRRTVTA